MLIKTDRIKENKMAAKKNNNKADSSKLTPAQKAGMRNRSKVSGGEGNTAEAKVSQTVNTARSRMTGKKSNLGIGVLGVESLLSPQARKSLNEKQRFALERLVKQELKRNKIYSGEAFRSKPKSKP